MPFSSLSDPVDLARAYGALDAAWAILQLEVREEDSERERERLAHIVAAFTIVATGEKDLVLRAIQRFREKSAPA